jgi:AcrR family transcriptional regulator
MARRAALSEAALADRLKPVFRANGYEGASLARLAAASGLAKAALYHRFPSGKEGMAMAVLAQVGSEMDELVLAPLRGPGPPGERLAAMIAGLRRFYANGREACLVEVLSTDGVPQALRSSLRDAVLDWIAALATVLIEAGLDPTEARRRGEDAVIRIQGALVLSRALQDGGPFERLMHDLSDELTWPSSGRRNTTQEERE